MAVNCPSKASDLAKGCIDKTWMDDNIYDLLDKIVDNTNVHLSAAGESTQSYITRNYGCLSKEEIDRIEDWLDALIALGRTPKRMYEQGQAPVLFPDPTTPAEVAAWAACGGYWASVAEVRACLTLNGDLKIMSEGTCLEHENANNYYLILECLANYKCYPTCQCPECAGETCYKLQECGGTAFILVKNDLSALAIDTVIAYNCKCYEYKGEQTGESCITMCDYLVFSTCDDCKCYKLVDCEDGNNILVVLPESPLTIGSVIRYQDACWEVHGFIGPAPGDCPCPVWPGPGDPFLCEAFGLCESYDLSYDWAIDQWIYDPLLAEEDQCNPPPDASIPQVSDFVTVVAQVGQPCTWYGSSNLGNDVTITLIGGKWYISVGYGYGMENFFGCSPSAAPWEDQVSFCEYEPLDDRYVRNTFTNIVVAQDIACVADPTDPNLGTCGEAPGQCTEGCILLHDYEWTEFDDCDACAEICYQLRPCDDMGVNGCNDPCNPPLPDVMYVYIDDLALDLAPANGLWLLTWNGVCNWTPSAPPAGISIMLTSVGASWTLTVAKSGTCKATFTATIDACNPIGMYAFQPDPACLDSGCVETETCECSVSATAEVMYYPFTGGTPGLTDITVTDDLSLDPIGSVYLYNDTCYVLLGPTSCQGGGISAGLGDPLAGGCDDPACSADCYLLRPCKPNTFDFCPSCATTGTERSLPQFIEITFTGLTGNLAQYNGTPYILPLLAPYACRYANFQFSFCPENSPPIPDIDITWSSSSPPDNAGIWYVQVTDIGSFEQAAWSGRTDEPCNPMGSVPTDYTLDAGDGGFSMADGGDPCKWHSDLDIATNTDLSAEFAAGSILKDIAGVCWRIVCTIPCVGQDCFGAPEYEASPLTPGWTVWESCAMCVDNCAACDPSLPSTINIRIQETQPGAFPSISHGSFKGDFVFEYVSDCIWAAYIGYYDSGTGGNCFTAPYLFDHWWYVLDLNTLVIADFVQCSDSAAEPQIDFNSGGVLSGWFWVDQPGGGCSDPCAFMPQSGPETFTYAINLDTGLCSDTTADCNPGSACNIQKYLVDDFSGLIGPQWSLYNTIIDTLVFAGSCTWVNDYFGFSTTVTLQWDGAKWVATLDTSYGGGGCHAIFNGPTDPCNPIGTYTFSSQDVTNCPGNDASSASLQIKSSY